MLHLPKKFFRFIFRTQLFQHLFSELGFKIANKAEYQFTEETAAKFFEHQSDLATDSALNAALLAGTALVLVLEKSGAVGEWRSAIGPLEGADKQAPESLRAMYSGLFVLIFRNLKCLKKLKTFLSTFLRELGNKVQIVSVYKIKILSLSKVLIRFKKVTTFWLKKAAL